MKLYDYSRSPSARRVRIFAAEKHIEIPKVPIDLAKGEHRTPKYLAINPRGEVPALELDDGMVITESVAICLYLEESEPGPRLFGLTPEEKATVLMWDRRIEWDGLHAVAEMLRNGNPAFADRALPGPIDYEQIPQLVERGRRRLGYFFDTLDERLAHNTYVAGEFFSVADITALVTIDFARVVDMRIPAEKTHLKRWYDAVSARPSAKA